MYLTVQNHIKVNTRIHSLRLHVNITENLVPYMLISLNLKQSTPRTYIDNVFVKSSMRHQSLPMHLQGWFSVKVGYYPQARASVSVNRHNCSTIGQTLDSLSNYQYIKDMICYDTKRNLVMWFPFYNTMISGKVPKWYFSTRISVVYYILPPFSSLRDHCMSIIIICSVHCVLLLTRQK